MDTGGKPAVGFGKLLGSQVTLPVPKSWDVPSLAVDVAERMKSLHRR